MIMNFGQKRKLYSHLLYQFTNLHVWRSMNDRLGMGLNAYGDII
jgi:hypothetical protein